MGLKSAIQDAAEAAFVAADDLRTSITVSVKTLGDTYDASAGTLTTGVREYHNIKAIVEDFGNKEIDGNLVQQGDKKILFSKSALTASPTTNDKVIIGTTTYHIVTVQIDAAEAVWELQVRANV